MSNYYINDAQTSGSENSNSANTFHNNNNNNNRKRKYNDNSSNNSNSNNGSNNSMHENGGGGGGGGTISSSSSNTSSIAVNTSKRSNHHNHSSHNNSNELYLKVLVPSYAAGGVIGRGGEKIAQIQKDAQVKMKMSKANDYYPGTNERICLISGAISSLIRANDLIMNKIQDKPDNKQQSNDEDRHNQIKMLIPHTVAGLLIGKGGCYIKQLKDESGAFVQISPKQNDLTERTVIIEGDSDRRNKALEMILKKLSEDTQYESSFSTNLSYIDHNLNSSLNMNNTSTKINDLNVTANPSLLAYPNQLLLALSKLNEINNQQQQNNVNNNQILQSAGLTNLALLIVQCGGASQMTGDSLKIGLRNLGYSTSSINDIIEAIGILLNNGLIIKQSGSSTNTNSTPPPPINTQNNQQQNISNQSVASAITTSQNQLNQLVSNPVVNGNSLLNNTHLLNQTTKLVDQNNCLLTSNNAAQQQQQQQNTANTNQTVANNVNTLLATGLLNNPNIGNLLQLLTNSMH